MAVEATPQTVERAERNPRYETTTYRAADVHSVHSRINWGAIFAGAVVAMSVFLLLTTLGAAIGLSVNQPGADDALSTGAAIWSVAVTLLSLALGGWIATQCTAGENRWEAAIYGIILWGVVFAVLLFLAASGVSAGFSAMLGVANVASSQVAVDVDRVTQEVQGLTPAQIEELRANVRSHVDPAKAAWWTFGGMVLAMIAAIGGAFLGAGPSPLFRAWAIERAA